MVTPRPDPALRRTLVFDIELLGIEEPKPIPAPADVAAAPADAKKTESGLAYKVLTKGTGTAKPAATSMVDVHYTGWTTDGKMFDSSVLRGKSAQFPLNAVIKGWTEGVQLMVEGEDPLLDSKRARLRPSRSPTGNARLRRGASQDR